MKRLLSIEGRTLALVGTSVALLLLLSSTNPAVSPAWFGIGTVGAHYAYLIASTATPSPPAGARDARGAGCGLTRRPDPISRGFRLHGLPFLANAALKGSPS
jgi:hypothetical protein